MCFPITMAINRILAFSKKLLGNICAVIYIHNDQRHSRGRKTEAYINQKKIIKNIYQRSNSKMSFFKVLNKEKHSADKGAYKRLTLSLEKFTND